MAKRRRSDETVKLSRQHLEEPSGCAVVVAPGTSAERRIAIGDQPVVIGSDPSVEIALDDPAVSRVHCEISRVPGGVRIRDLGSSNGTVVGGIAVHDAVLSDGVTIRVGETELCFVAAVDDEDDSDLGPIRFGDAVGLSSTMRRLFALLSRVASTDLPITLLGETGTGKDILARAIHSISNRKAGPFVVFDAGAVAPTLIESRLFGHVKGAFTGAVSDQKGQFEAADGGTLFLDEIGELQLELQPKLLRALEQRRICRLGSQTETPVDARFIAATNRDLEVEVAEGRFREDLFFRLGAAVVRVPPLRERREDIPMLVNAFVSELPGSVTVSDDALAVLQAQPWPGNVRELRNVIDRAGALAEGNVITPRDLMQYEGGQRRAGTLDGLPLAGRSLGEVEAAVIRQTLARYDGNKTRAAKDLGIAVSTLYEKIKKYGL